MEANMAELRARVDFEMEGAGSIDENRTQEVDRVGWIRLIHLVKELL
jgi:hypothetical protein